MKLRTKFSIPLVILIVSISLFLNYLFIRSEEGKLKNYIKMFGISLAKNLASNSQFGVLIGSKAELKIPVESISKEKDVVFAFILDEKNRGEVLAHSNPDEVGEVYNDTHSSNMLDADDITVLQYTYGPSQEEIFDISVPIFNKKKGDKKSFDSFLEEDGEELFLDEELPGKEEKVTMVKNGVARVGLSLAPLQSSIMQMKRKLYKITIAMIIILLLVLTSIFRVVTKPILQLAEAAKNIASGDFSHKVNIKSRDELGTLSKSFNYMSGRIDQSMKNMELTSNFNRSLISANNLSELLNTILIEVLNAQHVNNGAIMYFDTKNGSFVVRGAGTFLNYHKTLAKDKRFIEWFNKNNHVTNIERYLEKFTTDFAREYDEMTNLGVTMIIPLYAKEEVIGLFNFGHKGSGGKFSDTNIRFLTNLIQSAVIAIDNIILREKEAENEILKYELEFAKRVQESLLPSANPDISGLDIYTYSMPAKDVGGDYYDFIEFKESGGLAISIADVSGKGVPAALYMASTRGLLRSVAIDDRSSHDTLSKINELLFEVCDTKAFVTMFYAVMNYKTKTLSFANAGHTYPMHYKNGNGSSEKKCSYLVNNGLPLGVASVQNYSSDSVVLNKGEMVLFYTDGVVEAMNDSDELFGFDRLEELVDAHGHLSAKDFVETLLAKLSEFVGDIQFQDDLTIVALRVTD
ncbi:SpoIIE family protein phosphatase [Thermodesulfobacteriota bacterium]